MSLGALDAALSGLRVSQQQLNMISTNIANVGTEGYTRKILPQSTQAIAGQAVAVRGELVIRNVDSTLARDVWTQVSATSKLDTTLNYLQGIEDFHGPPDAEASFSAEIALLRDSFSALSDTPEDAFALSSTVAQAEETAHKINDFANLLTTMRNDAQSDLQISISRINDMLSQIAELNTQIKFQQNTGRSTAQLQDFRDEAVKGLSEEMEISFFTRGDGVMVIQTLDGTQLADENAEEILFAPVPISEDNYYPNGSVAGIYLRGNPDDVVGGVDLTPKELGGKVGALIELRDEILPQYSAQIDEAAHKLALRFEAQGLRLFTDADGNVPSDDPPVLDDDLTPNIDETVPVAYVGFASEMRINVDILNDHTLLRSGTYGGAVSTGSNEVIHRVLEYAFGETEYQSAEGTLDLRDAATGGIPLQEYLGVFSENTIAGSLDISTYADVNALITAAGGAGGLLDPANDTFRLTINGTNMDISMSNAALEAGATAADQIVAEINQQFVAGGFATSEAFASVSPSGQIVIESNYDVTIDATSPANAMGQAGLTYLGFTEGDYEATDPYLDIQVGNTPSVRITIDQTDTEAELLAKLQGITGLAVEDFTTSADGVLRLRPGEDYNNPNFGGGLKITSGPFLTEDPSDPNSAAPGAAALGTIYGAGEQVSLLAALFGSYNDPSATVGDIEETNPVVSNTYQSETYAGSGEYVSFRSQHLGPHAEQETELIGINSIIDFGQKVLNKQTENLSLTQLRFNDENTFKETIERQLLDESGVNIDEELSHLIVVQTSYNAAARALSAVQDLFDELLNAFR